MIFLIELEISGVAVQRIHQYSKKWWLCKELLSENDFEAVLATLYCYDYIVPTLLRQFRRLLQIKKIIANALRVL